MVMASAFCPDCGGKIVLGPKPKKGQWVSCPYCNADLEIVSLNPIELAWASYFEDDDEYDEDELEEEGDYWDDDFDDEEWDEEGDFDEEEWEDEEDEDDF